MKKKGLLSTLLIAGLLAAPTATLADTLPPGFHEDVLPITIHADGVYVPTDVEPYITAGRTMVPLRAAGEALDAEVVWDNPSRSITVQHDGDTVVFYDDGGMGSAARAWYATLLAGFPKAALFVRPSSPASFPDAALFHLLPCQKFSEGGWGCGGRRKALFQKGFLLPPAPPFLLPKTFMMIEGYSHVMRGCRPGPVNALAHSWVIDTRPYFTNKDLSRRWDILFPKTGAG